ncbi:S-adenosyl-L-homocysteine hydrolase [Tanacetum coccineum]
MAKNRMREFGLMRWFDQWFKDEDEDEDNGEFKGLIWVNNHIANKRRKDWANMIMGLFRKKMFGVWNEKAIDKYKNEKASTILNMVGNRQVLHMSCGTRWQPTSSSHELWNEMATSKYKNEGVCVPKHLDEKVVALHLGKLEAKLTKLTNDQPHYLNTPNEGPYKPAAYRY